MTMRKVTVTADVMLEIEIDDEAVSDWDGRKILDLADREDVYEAGTDRDDILGNLAFTLDGGGGPGRSDGWADFLPGCARLTYRNTYVNSVEVQ